MGEGEDLGIRGSGWVNNQERPSASLGKDKKPENQSPLTRFSLQPHSGQEMGQWGISRVDNGGREH